jgi:NAD+ synthase (glutamine-hydrolysing)
VKIALAQINPTVGALRENAAKMVSAARDALRQGAELIVFPELAICGYPPRDLVEKPDFVAANQRWLRDVSLEVPEIAVLSGCVTPAREQTGKSVHNSALVLQAGQIVFQQSKMLLPTYDVFDEARNFAAAERQQIWNWRGRRIGLTICEDAWNDKNFWPRRNVRLLYPRDPVAEQLRAGAEFMINISASPYSAGKIEVREQMLAAIAREYRTPVIAVNQVGGNDQLVFDGSSMVIDGAGGVTLRLDSFAEDATVLEIGCWGGVQKPRPASSVEAMFRALVLGTRDYVHKCGFQHVVIGLSGGIDSAVTAAIAVEALGPGRVLGISMPSRFSSRSSVTDAQRLAENLGIRLRTVPIEKPFAGFDEALRLGCDDLPVCSSQAADLTEQNLQARIRGTILMAFSNRTGALVLSTGNKSELATGYCTLYGDMAGGLAVISDVLKTQVYELARWLNREREVIPEGIIAKAPSAELRPNQTDQDDLPPYEIVDAVVRDYVESYLTGEEIAAARRLPLPVVQDVIRRIDHSEYKRQQAAPGIKVSVKAFGMGRRFPIAQRYISGGSVAVTPDGVARGRAGTPRPAVRESAAQSAEEHNPQAIRKGNQ